MHRDLRIEKEFPDWGAVDLRASEAAFGDLASYAGRPPEEIAAEYWRRDSAEDADAQRKVGEARDEAPVMDYYAHTAQYLYELSYWESTLDKQLWFRVLAGACKANGLRRLLDFGGGVGGLSLALRSRGIECDHLDVPGKTREYAAWRFSRRAPGVRVLNAMRPEEWPSGEYDAVVAWDVLEHIFDLEGTLGRINRLLRPGGWLISKSTFAPCGGGDHHEAIHLAQHSKYHDLAEFNRMLAGQGFQYAGQLKPDRITKALRKQNLAWPLTGFRIDPRLKHGGNFLIHKRG